MQGLIPGGAAAGLAGLPNRFDFQSLMHGAAMSVSAVKRNQRHVAIACMISNRKI